METVKMETVKIEPVKMTSDRDKVIKYKAKIIDFNMKDLFSEKSLKCILDMINANAYLKDTVCVENISYVTDFNCEKSIFFKNGDRLYKFILQCNTIIEKDNIVQSILLEEIINTNDANLKSIDFCNVQYSELIKTQIIMAYILNDNNIIKKLNLSNTNNLNRFTNGIIQLVFKYIDQNP
jgi:hypothetical protein